MLGTIKAIAAARDAYILETRAAVSLRVFFRSIDHGFAHMLQVNYRGASG